MLYLQEPPWPNRFLKNLLPAHLKISSWQKAVRINTRMLRVHGIKRIILLLCLLAVLASSEEAPKICAFSVRLSSPDQQDRINTVRSWPIGSR